MSRRTTQFIYSLFGINQNPPPAPPPPPPARVPIIRGSSSAADNFANPLNDPAIATKLTQVNNGIATADQFDMARQFNIFVPSKLATDFANAPLTTKARVSLFFGVGPELDLFRLRDFFANENNSVIITIPGVESESSNPPAADDSWPGIHTAFGYGITTGIINTLLSEAGLPTIDFSIEVMAGYSTGYRGLNLTIINELVDLTKLTKVIYLDAWYHHDDHPLMPAASPYFKKNTLFAIDTAMTKSPNTSILIYAFTHPGGVPRSNPSQTNQNIPNPPREPIAPLKAKYGNKIKFIDFEFKDSKPPIDDALEKICLARLIQLALGGDVQANEVANPLKALIDALPARGSFGTLGAAQFTDLYGWVTSHHSEITGFSITNAMRIITTHQLLGDWTDASHYEMRHRMFVLELGKEPLLP